MLFVRDFGDDVFVFTAQYYDKFRAHYPRQVFDDIVNISELNRHGQLLGFGCGSGELAIPLAKYLMPCWPLILIVECLKKPARKLSVVPALLTLSGKKVLQRP
jgi:hypothetical protein